MPEINRISKIIITLLLVTMFFIVYSFFAKTSGNRIEIKKNPRGSQSIAVLPFENTGNDSSEEYLSDGLSDGILTSLSYFKNVKVCARSSSFQFRGNEIDAKDVGRKLGVSTVLGGSVRLAENRIFITVHLVNVENGSNFWTEQFDESMDNVFLLQQKIAKTVSEKMNLLALLNDGTTLLDKKPTTNNEAYGLYLKGRSAWMLKTAPELKKGIDFFQKAISLDPSYAAAYAGIADCYTALGYGSFMAPKESFPKAYEAAVKALELDSTLSEPHASLGFYKFYFDWDWAASEQEFRQAIALNPNYAMAYAWYAYYLTSMRRYDEAMVILNKALMLDPLSAQINTDIGFAAYYSGKYNVAIKQLQTTIQRSPKFMLGHIWLGRSYQAKKMYPEAIDEYKKALSLSAGWPVALAQIGNVYGMSGDKLSAVNILDSLNAVGSKNFVTAYGMALVYVSIGKVEQTFLWLNKALDERSNWLVWLKTDPRWDPIRSDKRYAELVNKVGLPD